MEESIEVLSWGSHYVLSSYGHDFRGWGGSIEHKMCPDFLYNFCLKRIILRIIQRDTINVHRPSRKVPVVLVRF